MPLRLYLRRPRRSWWLVSSEGTLVWDYWTHRAASRTADALNAKQVALGRSVRFRVERMP